MRLRHGVVLLVLLVLLAAGHFAWWWFLVGRLRDDVAIWLQAHRAEGWTVTATPPSSGGWPLVARVSLGDFSIARGEAQVPGLRYQAEHVDLTLSLFHPYALTVSPRGRQRLKVGSSDEVAATAQDMAFLIPLDADPDRGELHATAFRLMDEQGHWEATAAHLDGHAEAHAQPGAVPSIDFNLQAESIALPATFRWPLGQDVRSMAARGILSGPFPAGRSIVAGLAAWRDGGGSLELSHAGVEWGPLILNASATLALDDQLQPMGSGSAKATGYAETLDRLASAGVMTKSAATVAKAMLSLLAGGDEPSSVDVPLTLQYRTLSMRQVPLMRVPELDWPRQ